MPLYFANVSLSGENSGICKVPSRLVLVGDLKLYAWKGWDELIMVHAVPASSF